MKYYDKNTEVFLDGEWVRARDAKLNVFSQTLHYGSGVFDGLRAYETPSGPRIFKAKEHFERLRYSAKKMHITLPYQTDKLIELAYEVLERNQLQNAYIRPLVFLGSSMTLELASEIHFMMTAWQWPRYPKSRNLHVKISSYTKPGPSAINIDTKSVGNYVHAIMATAEAKQAGFDDALLLDNEGLIAEGPGSNFFLEKNNELYTPPPGKILAGITRQTIIELAGELDIPVHEQPLTVADLHEADYAFFTGTAMEIAGIQSVDKVVFSQKWEDSISYNLYLMYQKHVHYGEFKDFSLV